MKLFRRILDAVRQWWRPPVKVEPAKVEAKPEPKRGHEFNYDRDGIEEAGAFYFKRAILDDLKGYFDILHRFRRADPDGYDLYTKVGGTVVPRSALAVVGELSAAWKQRDELRSFGCVWFGFVEKDRSVFYPKFGYFQKLKHRNNVEPSNGTTYLVSLYYDSTLDPPKWLRKAGFMIEFYVAVEGSNIRLLKVNEIFTTSITQRGSAYVGSTNSGHAKGRTIEQTRRIPYQKWVYPNLLERLFKEHKDEHKLTSVQKYGADYFRMLVSFCDADMAGGIRVIATKGEESAAFNVDYKRTAYFFRDRETTLNSKGSKARIFHIVRPHLRVTGGGERAVKLHFRGLRQFEWNGYQVLISVPGKHHPALDAFTGSSVEEGDESIKGPMLNAKQLGTHIRDVIERGVP